MQSFFGENARRGKNNDTNKLTTPGRGAIMNENATTGNPVSCTRNAKRDCGWCEQSVVCRENYLPRAARRKTPSGVRVGRDGRARDSARVWWYPALFCSFSRGRGRAARPAVGCARGRFFAAFWLCALPCPPVRRCRDPPLSGRVGRGFACFSVDFGRASANGRGRSLLHLF